jgi:hypothetical protein
MFDSKYLLIEIVILRMHLIEEISIVNLYRVDRELKVNYTTVSIAYANDRMMICPRWPPL